jgi:hypothetical protein
VEAYDGPQVVGMDLHRRRSLLVRMTSDGQRLGISRVTSSPAELGKEIARAGRCPEMVVEATLGWYRAADALAAVAARVHLAHALRVKAFTYRRVKTMRKTPRTWRTCCAWDGCRRRGSPRQRSASCVS